MTISIPPSSSESLVPGATAPAADANPSAPAEGFDQLMATGEQPVEAATEAPAGEQAAVLAASILWAPLPLLVATPPPALPETLAGAPAATNLAEGGEEVLPAATSFTNEASLQEADAAVAGFRAPEMPGRAEALAAASSMPSDRSETCHVLRDMSPGRSATGAGLTEKPGTTSEVAATAVAEPEAATSVSLQVDRPAPRRAMRSGDWEEKIADMPLTPAGRLPVERMEGVKTFVSRSPEEDKMEQGIVGTGVAKSGSEMPYAIAELPPAAAHASAHVAPDWQHLQFDLSAHAEPAHQARDTVATVLSVIDAQEKPESLANRAVTMDFDFGAEKLAVRVEFRDGAVRAHFRTQSLELRSALASEWSHVAAAPENILRAVEPVFVTSSRSEQSASFNADGGAHRQPHQSPASEFNQRAAATGLRGARAVEAAAPAAPDESLRLRRPYTTRHLHAIA